MGHLQKKCCTTGEKSLAYRGESGQNTGNDFLVLGLGVVLYPPICRNLKFGDLVLGPELCTPKLASFCAGMRQRVWEKRSKIQQKIRLKHGNL